MFENNQTNSNKSNRRGGARKNAGRKAGSATTKTREIADKAIDEGITPLEVMLKAMMVNMTAFNDTQSMDALQAAANYAKDAAPYIHPRLASTDLKATVVTKTLDQELSELNAAALANADSNPALA